VPSQNPVELSILLPVRNEGINLQIMLRILRATVDEPHEVLVVHDDERDESVPVVDAMRKNYPNIRCVYNTLGRGVVNALRSGVANANGRYVLIFAADEIGPVLAIEDMLALMREGCGFVSCTRYAHGGRRLGGSLLGSTLSRTANFLFSKLSGTAFTDATTGIKLFRRELFEKLDLQSRPIGWAVAFEMAIKAQLSGCRLGEVPIVSIDRLYGGVSTFRPGPWILEYLRWFLFGLRRLHRLPREMRQAPMVRVPKSVPIG